MNRTRWIALLTSLLLSLPLIAQEPTVLGPEQAVGTNALQMPDQLRRVPPPSKTASREELEAQADVLRSEKNYADAIDYYRAAMKKRDSAVLENKAGIAELQMQRVEDAKDRFEKAVKMDRTYPDALNNLGVAYYMKHNYKKAIKSYRQAIKERPESPSFHSNLGSAYFASKEFDRASLEYNTAMQIDPEIFTRQSTSGVSAKLGSPEDRAKFHFTIAKVFAQHGDTDNCILYLRKAMEDGFPAIDDVYKEAVFASILKDPRFVTLMASKPQAVK
jgi:tetratricopeptide (TPR) repeat protein